MTPKTPADERSSPASSTPPENVVFLDSTNTTPLSSDSAIPAKETSPSAPDPFQMDGGATIKTGGMPPLAWQSSAAELAQLLTGKQLGSYVIEASLGTGGMAAVFRAVDPQLDRKVALKVLPPMLAVHQEQVQRFEREARLAAQLDDEHVARVHQYGQDQGLHFIAYEYVEGTNLRELMIQKGGRLEVVEAIDFLKQAAEGLAHTAERGIVHRDIKPSNLVITAQGKLKLVDLGLARNSLIEDSAALTQAGATLGTFDYLSPEQAIDPRLADVRSDIYSLGCTFYHALTGVPPVPEGTAARKLHSHQMELPRDPRELNDQITPELFDILCRMLAKKPEDRYPSAVELKTDLERLTGSVIEPSISVPGFIHRAENDSPWYVTAGCLLLLLGLAAGFEVWQSSGNHSSSSIASQYQEVPSKNSIETPAAQETRDKTSVPVSLEIDSLEEMIQALKHPGGGTLYLKRPLYEMSGSTAIQFKGGSWIVRPLEGGTTTLRLLESAETPMIEVLAGTLQLQQLKLEIPGTANTGIVAYDGVQVTLQQCELVRPASMGSSFTRQNPTRSPFVRLAGGNNAGTPATLEVKGSIWHPSTGIGVALETSAFLQFEDCWIGPQYQFVTMPALDPSNAKRVALFRNCSIAQAQDACLRIAGSTPTRLELDHCLFSRMTSASGTLGDESAWMVVDVGAQVDLQSSEALFHRMPAFCMVQRDGVTRETLAKDWHQLRTALTRFRDEGTSILTRSPWMESKPWQRYQETRKLSALALKTDFSTVGPDTLLGQSMRSNPAVARETNDALNKSSRVLTVDGHGDDPGTFSTVNSALGSISDEEETTIIVQLQGVVPVKPTEIGNSRVIIKAAEGYRPELAFHRDTIAGPDGEAHLFRIHDGELTLENVRVRLEALRDPAKTLSLMLVTGTGRGRLKDSFVTLKSMSELTANVYTVGDPTGMMNPSANKPPRPGLARIECVDTIIRGSGQVLFVQTSRPFLTQVHQAGIALDGILFAIDGNRADMAMPNETAILTIDRSTCYSTRGIVQMRTSTAMPQIMSMRCQASQSILAVGETQPIIRLEMQQADGDLKRKLIWQGKRNCYASSGPLLTLQQLDQTAMATVFDAGQWSELWGSDDEQAQMIRTLPMAGVIRQTPLSEWEAGEFVMKLESSSSMNLREIGLPVEAMPRAPSGQTP